MLIIESSFCRCHNIHDYSADIEMMGNVNGINCILDYTLIILLVYYEH